MSFRRPSVAALLAVSAARCSPPFEAPDPSAPGEAAEAITGTYCITDVQTDPVTYHFDSPRWVLQAAEGLGPRVLALTVAGYAAALVTTTTTQRPKESEISTAVGYSLSEFYYLQASAAHTVDDRRFRRLEAYINYARSVWVIREAGCGAVLGTGVSFKPIGVYFAVRSTGSVAIPGTSVIGFIPNATGGPGGFLPYQNPPSSQASDAGAGDAGDAGTGDAGAGDAGTGDAGAGDAGDQ
ncbi:MAG: hypothetical protein QM820_51930 [Minicystis sp.]